ncbi:MAG: HAD-IA family hydrolase [Flavobacteriales bacterium]|nr:HAD-IA family hydrolase [Flavobacteriales bacterium]
MSFLILVVFCSKSIITSQLQAFAKLGFTDFKEIYTQANQNPIFDKLETGKVSNEEFMQYLHSFVPKATRQEVDEAWNCILLYIMPEQVEMVHQVKNSGRKTFMLSNTNAIHVVAFEKMIAEKMDINHFRSAFEKIYYSNVIGIKKPYPETYLKVCEWNNLIPSETLFIDDSIQHVKGAGSRISSISPQTGRKNFRPCCSLKKTNRSKAFSEQLFLSIHGTKGQDHSDR